MTHAISINQIGTSDVLNWEKVDIEKPKADEVLIRHKAIGLNYIDIYFRTGLYPLDTFPSILGMEAAGVVEAIGPQVQVTSGDVSVVYQGDVILGRLAMGADFLNPAACVELFALFSMQTSSDKFIPQLS